MRAIAISLVLGVGLLLGLLLAFVVNGRMAHLRALALPLPAWSEVIDESAGIMRGRAALGEATLGWRLQTIGRPGPVWQFRLDGPGLALAAPAVLSLRSGAVIPSALMLAPVTGHLDSAALSDGRLQGWPEARLAFTRGHLAFDLHRGVVSRLETEGLASAVIVDGRALGSGRFTLTHESEGDWRLSADLVAHDSAEGLALELRLDFAAGQAALSVLPATGGQDPAESVLRALALPAWPGTDAVSAP